MREADSDFDYLQAEDANCMNTKYGPGRTGKLEDGKRVTVRPGSSEGSPTLEVRKPVSGVKRLAVLHPQEGGASSADWTKGRVHACSDRQRDFFMRPSRAGAAGSSVLGDRPIFRRTLVIFVLLMILRRQVRIAWFRNACPIILLCLGVALSSCSSAEDDNHMLSDLTIYLQPPILGQGGTVIIVPREVAMDQWQPQSTENPARSDPYLASRKPLPPGARRLGVVLRDEVSIVQFDYPQGGTFNFRFAPALGSDFPWDMLKTKEIGTGGEGKEMDEKTGEVIKVGFAMHIHVLGTEVTEADSRIVESGIKIGALQSRYPCRDYELAIACDASGAAR